MPSLFSETNMWQKKGKTRLDHEDSIRIEIRRIEREDARCRKVDSREPPRLEEDSSAKGKRSGSSLAGEAERLERQAGSVHESEVAIPLGHERANGAFSQSFTCRASSRALERETTTTTTTTTTRGTGGIDATRRCDRSFLRCQGEARKRDGEAG